MKDENWKAPARSPRRCALEILCKRNGREADIRNVKIAGRTRTAVCGPWLQTAANETLIDFASTRKRQNRAATKLTTYMT